MMRLRSLSTLRVRIGILSGVSIALFLELLLFLASFTRPDVVVDVGPSTGSYGTGFTSSWEYNPVTARFLGRYGSLELPLDVSGGELDEARLTLRAARLWRSSIETSAYVNRRRALSFRPAPSEFDFHDWERGGRESPFERFETASGVTAIQEGPLEIELTNSEGAGGEYALAVDWIRLSEARVRVPFRAYPVRLLVLSLLPLLLASGWSMRVSVGMTSGGAALAALAAAFDPFWLVHAASRLTLGMIVGSALLVLLFRRFEWRRFLLLLFVAGYLIKGIGILSPRYFYADVRSHRRYALAYAGGAGNFWERGAEAQKRAGVAYPTHIAGRDYAFAYSPLFYLPFLPLVPDEERIDEGMKLVSLVAASLEPLLVFALTRAAFGPSAALFAGILSVILPPLYSRLLLAMWPAITGHIVGCFAMAAAVLALARPEDGRIRIAYWSLLFFSLPLYVLDPITVGAFVVSLALLERAWSRLLVPYAVALVVTTFILYGPFLLTFFEEIVPRISASEGPATLNQQSLSLALGRIPIFYGFLYPVLTVWGIVEARRRETRLAYRALLAYGLGFAVLVGLRAFGRGMFWALKEMLFVAPLVAIGSGVALASVSRRGPRLRIAAWVTTAGLAGWGLLEYREYLDSVTFLEGLD